MIDLERKTVHIDTCWELVDAINDRPTDPALSLAAASLLECISERGGRLVSEELDRTIYLMDIRV